MPESCYGMLSHLCHRYLEPLRDAYGPTRVVSGYRTRGYNRLVGGAPQSFHIYRSSRQGVAADVSCARGTPAAWFAFLDELVGDGGVGRYSGHVHVDNRAGHARW